MSFQNLRIGVRLGLGFGLLIVLMLMAIAVAVVRFSQVSEVNTRIIESDWVKADAANTINATTRANARRTMELLIVNDAAELARVRTRIAENKKTIDDALATLDRLIYLPEGKQLLADLKTRRGQYVASFGKVGQLVEQGAVAQLMVAPQHPYTRRLLASRPRRDVVEAGTPADQPAALHARQLGVTYPVPLPGVRGWFRKGVFEAVRHVDFDLAAAVFAGSMLRLAAPLLLAAIAMEKPVPVYFIGVGEKLEDLETFNAREFAQALLN